MKAFVKYKDQYGCLISVDSKCAIVEIDKKLIICRLEQLEVIDYFNSSELYKTMLDVYANKREVL